MTDSCHHRLRIAIIGGGITGLAAAYALGRARRSGAPVDEFILEASGRLGGVIRSEQAHGFVIEGGPDSFLTEKPEARVLCDELGLAGDLIGSQDEARQTYILRRGRLIPMPAGLMFFVPVDPWSVIRTALLSPIGKLELLRDLFQRPRTGAADESVADFTRRHFGRDLLESLVEPLLMGVYGGEPENLSVRTVLPRYAAIEAQSGSIIRGMAQHRAGRTRPVFTTLKGGLGDLVQALSDHLTGSNQAGRILTRQEAVEISPAKSGYSIRCKGNAAYEADAIILALPACQAAKLLNSFQTELSMLLGSIVYVPAVTASLAFHAAPQLPAGFGFLVPRSERDQLLACTFVHQKFSGRAPVGGALLRCFLSGPRYGEVLEWSDQEVIAAVMRELRGPLKLSRAPDFYKVFRWPLALPQYSVGHGEKVQEIRRKLKDVPGLFLAGNSYSGLGIPDCIRSGLDAARDALQYGGS